MADIPYAEIDPGIRDTVWWLNDRGFPTTDSGDGVSKFKDPDNQWGDMVMEFPHVVISVSNSDMLCQECRRLRYLLQCWGLPVGQQDLEDTIFIQGTYDPALPDGAYILVGNLNDEMLQSSSGFQDKSDTQG